MKQKNKNRRKFSVYISVNSADNGFSLIEILVAIGIMSVGIIAIVSLFSANLKDEIRDKNKLTAIYLAQEALEVVRWQRDSNWKAGAAWGTDFVIGNNSIIGLTDKDDITDGWEIIVSNAQREKVYSVSDAFDNFLYYSQLKSAIPDNWNETNFKRWLTINNDCGADCLTVTAFVSHPNFSPDIQVSTRIYDWKKP